jgi:RNA polymerase sigma-70 factor (ECF subfamily)
VTDVVETDVSAELDKYRRELTGYCYRMLGSAAEADDAVQDTMVRAWKAYDRFEGRSSLRSWLYRIATNVCFDMLNGRQRRARPVDMSEVKTPASRMDAPLPESAWVQPIPDDRIIAAGGDPEEAAVNRDTIRLAFIAALQYLPPKQRAVLILREVLRWKAEEVSELLDTTVASVNSALQRARSTLASSDLSSSEAFSPSDEVQQALLERYLDAFARYDVDALVKLLHEDATISMPPVAFWLRGPDDIAAWFTGPGADCAGSHVLPVMANGSFAFAQYRPSGPGGAFEPWALQVIETRGDKVANMIAFLNVDEVFPLFGLPQDPTTQSPEP